MFPAGGRYADYQNRGRDRRGSGVVASASDHETPTGAPDAGTFDIPLFRGVLHELGHGVTAHELRLEVTGIYVPLHFIASDGNVYARGTLTTGVPRFAGISEAIAAAQLVDPDERHRLAVVAVAGVVAEGIADPQNVEGHSGRFRTRHNFNDLKKFRLLVGHEDETALTSYCDAAEVIVRSHMSPLLDVAQQIEESCRGNAARCRGEAFHIPWTSVLVALRAKGASI